MNHKLAFKQGMIDGIPIALGYIAVSFTFGILAKDAGLTVESDFRRTIRRSWYYYRIRILSGNGVYPVGHQSALLPYVLCSFPKTGSGHTIFPSFFYSLW